MSAATKDRCRRCSVYRYVHDEGRGCGHFRKATPPEVWIQDHSLSHHVSAWLWLKVPTSARWEVVSRIYDAMPDLCWCDLVDAALTERERLGCLCDVHLPVARRLKPEDYGNCYCPSPEQALGGAA